MAITAVILAGCAATTPPLFVDHRRAIANDSSPGSAFESYAKAAESAEVAAAKYIDRTTFTPGKKDEAIRLLEPALKLIESTGDKEFDFFFESTPPFQERKYRKGWRLIGNALVWKIEDAVRKQDYHAAGKLYLTALRFGLNLSGGSALDASLGYSIADDARIAIASAVPQMDSSTLEMLGQGIERALSAGPSIQQTLDNERSQMLEAVQSIQEAYLQGDFALFKQELRADILPAVRHLEERRNHRQEVVAYFENLAREAEGLTKFYKDCSTMNARQRAAIKPPKFSESRPWRRWSKFFFRSPESLFVIRDRNLARTRLLALHALLKAKSKKGGPLPADLSAFETSIATDPYSGKPFIYRVAGSQYRLYSVGQDGKDNGGETEESFSTPDLLIETNDL